jgi:endoglycosylceramidase
MKCFIFLCTICSVNSYSVQNNRIVDKYGRERLYHGVNVIYKKYPWHPILDKFNYNLSFTEDDYKIIYDLGLNVIRLGVMWPGVEPKPGYYNITYLKIMENIVNNLDRYNISVIIEFHQDALSEYFCGEGMPDWLMNMSNFPVPLSLPYNKSGKPSVTDCELKQWWEYQFSLAAGEMYEKLYTNTYYINYFLNYWNIVAKTFNSSNNVIGYEIINEPWPGNIYTNPKLLLPKYGDKIYLQSFYDKIFNNLSKSGYLNDKLFFFEPVTWSINGVGFEHPPNNNTRKNVLSYHCYFPPNLSAKQIFRTRLNDLEKLNVAGFITEMGSTKIYDIFDYTDPYFQSWTVWQYKKYSGITGDVSMFFNKNGTIANTRYLLNRSYPRAICGHGTYFDFNITSKKVVLRYINNPDCGSNTELYISLMPVNYTIQFNVPVNHYFNNKVLYIEPHKNDTEIIVTII